MEKADSRTLWTQCWLVKLSPTQSLPLLHTLYLTAFHFSEVWVLFFQFLVVALHIRFGSMFDDIRSVLPYHLSIILVILCQCLVPPFLLSSLTWNLRLNMCASSLLTCVPKPFALPVWNPARWRVIVPPSTRMRIRMARMLVRCLLVVSYSLMPITNHV